MTGHELLEAIAELRSLFPDWRMGQLITTLTMAAGGMEVGAIWDTEDEQLLAAARRLIEQTKSRREFEKAVEYVFTKNAELTEQ
jgi:hypothetical protein